MVVVRTLLELPSDIFGDILFDLRLGFGGGEVVSKEIFVECEDALDFDAEGDLECGVDHLDGALVCGCKVATLKCWDVFWASGDCVCRHPGTLSTSLKYECNLRRERA